MSGPAFAAVDLGAGSGRVILGRVEGEAIALDEVHRFVQPTCQGGGRDRWSLGAMFAEVARGLALAGERAGELASIGVDTWGVDFGLIDAEGRLLADPVRYRDPRTDGMLEELHALVPRAELYARTGIQFQPFNTLVQLLAQVRQGEWPEEAATLLMMPDLIHHLLCGSRSGELTIASTSMALEARSRTWDRGLLEAVGVPGEVMPELVGPGTLLGRLKPALAEELGLGAVPVVCPAAHDTASAVAATPLEEGWAFVSSGTWSLVGIEAPEPVLSEEAMEGGFTNEAGVFGTTRFLVNCAGLWILESCREVWRSRGLDLDHAELLRRVAASPSPEALIDPDDLRFLHPEDMVAEVRAHLEERGARAPEDPAALARLILESIARRTAQILERLREVTGRSLSGVHVVGGGSQNDFLNQAIADASGLPVRAGPVEATALGNVCLQAIQAGAFKDLAEARAAIARSFPCREFGAG